MSKSRRAPQIEYGKVPIKIEKLLKNSDNVDKITKLSPIFSILILFENLHKISLGSKLIKLSKPP